MTENKTCGELMKSAREEALMTQAEVGEVLGVHKSMVSMMEAGDRAPPTEVALRKLARLTGARWEPMVDARRMMMGVAPLELWGDGDDSDQLALELARRWKGLKDGERRAIARVLEGGK